MPTEVALMMIRKINVSLISAVSVSIIALCSCNVPTTPVGTDPNANPSPSPVSGGDNPVSTPTPPSNGGGTPVNNGGTYSTPSAPGATSSLAGSLGIADTVDMRANDGPVLDQFGGTCSTFGTAAALDNVLHAKGINKNVSEEHLWSLYGVYDMDAAIAAASSNYITEEQYWPVNGSAKSNYEDYASLKITQTKNLNYDMNAALQALNAKHPLIMAIQVPSDMDNCNNMVASTSTYTSGQHVIEAVGYQLDSTVAGGGYFILKNSWGTQCGDNGYQYYPFSLCQRTDLYCYFTEVDDAEDRLAK